MDIDLQTKVTSLDERVTNLRASFTHLEGTVNSGFSTINNQLAGLARDLQASQKTPWSVIWAALGVGVTVIVAIGGLAYYPITQSTARLEIAVHEVNTRLVPRDEINFRSEQASKERERMNEEIRFLRENTIGRYEWNERNRGIDQQEDNINRRIDELRDRYDRTYPGHG